MDIGGTLRELRKSKKMSQMDTAKFLSMKGCPVTQKSVSKWERGDTLPNARQLLLMCELYKVRDVLDVFCGLPPAGERLNDIGKRRVEEYIRLLERDKEFSYIPERAASLFARTIPLYDMPVSAGTGQFLDSDRYELIDVDETVPLSATFAVRISGDSMSPRYVDRQIVYVKPQPTLENGEIGIFLLNGDAYCKVLDDDDGPELVSINRKYMPIKISEYDDLKVIGKVVG